jgi:RNA polymerase sigma factor (TIGR02999 family)
VRPTREVAITGLLTAWRQGDAEAGAELIRFLYPRLRRLALRELSRSGLDLSLHPTELVHELYLKLVGRSQPVCENRAHFFAIAARLLRDILVDHVRRKSRLKRGEGGIYIELSTLAPIPVAARVSTDLLALDEALLRLSAVSEDAVRVVELRYFGGLTVNETAEALGLSRATVSRSWRFARAWLRQALEEAADGG